MQADGRQRLNEIVDGGPETEINIDIDAMTVSCPNESFDVSMKDSARQAFLAGTYDPLDKLLASKAGTRATAERLGYVDRG